MVFVSDKTVKRGTALSRKSINNHRTYGLKFLDALNGLCLTEAIFQEVVKNSYAELHEYRTDGLFPAARSQVYGRTGSPHKAFLSLFVKCLFT